MLRFLAASPLLGSPTIFFSPGPKTALGGPDDLQDISGERGTREDVRKKPSSSWFGWNFPQSSQINCVVLCTVLPPQGGYPIAFNKYISLTRRGSKPTGTANGVRPVIASSAVILLIVTHKQVCGNLRVSSLYCRTELGFVSDSEMQQQTATQEHNKPCKERHKTRRNKQNRKKERERNEEM